MQEQPCAPSDALNCHKSGISCVRRVEASRPPRDGLHAGRAGASAAAAAGPSHLLHSVTRHLRDALSDLQQKALANTETLLRQEAVICELRRQIVAKDALIADLSAALISGDCGGAGPSAPDMAPEQLNAVASENSRSSSSSSSSSSSCRSDACCANLEGPSSPSSQTSSSNSGPTEVMSAAASDSGASRACSSRPGTSSGGGGGGSTRAPRTAPCEDEAEALACMVTRAEGLAAQIAATLDGLTEGAVTDSVPAPVAPACKCPSLPSTRAAPAAAVPSEQPRQAATQMQMNAPLHHGGAYDCSF
jgi:hypothetical protein